MYGARYEGSLIGCDPVLREYNASGTFAINDFVMDDGSTGEITVATATSSILGIAQEAATAASTGVLVNITPFAKVLMDNDNAADTFAATHVNQWGDFTGATSLMQVDTSDISSTKAQLLVLEYNPQNMGYDSDTSIGLFMVAEYALSQQAAA